MYATVSFRMLPLFWRNLQLPDALPCSHCTTRSYTTAQLTWINNKFNTYFKSVPSSANLKGAQWGRFRSYLHNFYRAVLCIRGILAMALCLSVRLSVRLSVCLSVTCRCSTKTAKRRITQTTPHDSPGTLVFWRQRSPRNSTGVTLCGGAKCRWGGSKSVTFDK